MKINASDMERLPDRLLTINDLTYAGAFTLPADTFGSSNANWAEGIIEANGDSLFFVGHKHHNAIAEFQIPALGGGDSISTLPSAGPPLQSFTPIIERVHGGNTESLDTIVGLEVLDGTLIGNAIEYYDAPADNKATTFVLQDANNIAASEVSGFFEMQGRTRAAGWLSGIPAQWQRMLECTHISGNSSGTPIIARHSIGPSAFCVNLDKLNTDSKVTRIKTQELLGFDLQSPMEKDLYNESGSNQRWTHLSHAKYGFVVPDTSTYATFGYSGGHRSGVGYKLDRGDSESCPGPCQVDPTDEYNYYWFWDVRDLIKVKTGALRASEVRPYEYGIFRAPFQKSNSLNGVGGASYDAERKILYMSILNANDTLGEYANPPVIVGYTLM